MNRELQAGRRALVETLEPRRLLAAAAVPVVDGFAANVNFQPESVGPVAETRADFGRAFDVRGNGLSYGWNRDLEADGRMVDADSQRTLPGLSYGGNNANGPAGEDQDVDERFDTFARVEAGDEWAIDVPDGFYVVGFSSGDPDYQGGFGEARLAWDVNGTPAMNVMPTGRYPWGEAVAYVRVTDGQVRLTAGEESDGNTLLWARIAQVQPPANYAAGRSVDWRASELESPISRIEPGVVRHGNKLYVIGGYTDYYDAVTRRVDVLDLNTLTWSEGAPLPDAAAQTHAGVALDEANGAIYWIGGQFGTSGVRLGGGTLDTTRASFRYDIAANTWTRVFDAPAVAYAPGAVVVGDELHLFGGSDATRINPRSEHDVIDLAAYAADPASATWTPAAPMIEASDHFAVSTVGNKVYVVGGEYSHSASYVPRRDVQIYDPASDSWTLGQPIPKGVSHVEGTTVEYDGRLWVMAGKELGNRGTPVVQSYDPATDTWRTHNDLGLYRFGGIAFEREGRFYYLAGDDFKDQLARGGVEGDAVS